MMRHCRHVSPGLLMFGIVAFAAAASFGKPDPGIVRVTTRNELVDAVNLASPGTQILVAPGEYRGGLSFTGLRGVQRKPIVIGAVDPANPPKILGGASGIHLRDVAWIELRNLILSGATGNGLNIDDGGDLDKPASRVVLSGLVIRDVGPKGNHDGIKLSGVDNFTIEKCVVERWGDSGSAIDMVGCHNGVISGCEFCFRSEVFGNGVQTKGGSSDITIRQCRFDNAGSRAINIGGSTGSDYFRPRDATYEARNITVEDNHFIGSMSPVAFVGVDGATVRFNTIYRPTRWAIRILQESQGDRFVPCRNGVFASNLVVYRAADVRSVVNVGGGTSPETFRFSANHWYCEDEPQRSRPRDLPVPENDGTYGTPPDFRDAASGDLRLSDRSPGRNAGVRRVQP